MSATNRKNPTDQKILSVGIINPKEILNVIFNAFFVKREAF